MQQLDATSKPIELCARGAHGIVVFRIQRLGSICQRTLLRAEHHFVESLTLVLHFRLHVFHVAVGFRGREERGEAATHYCRPRHSQFVVVIHH